MSTEITPQNPTNLNIDAAKEYISSVETSIVAEPARAALGRLKEGLASTGKTKQDLMALAQGVASAQGSPDSKFTVQEFENQIMAPSVPKSTEGTPEKNDTLPRNATAEYIVEKVYETKNETLIDGAEILLGTLGEGLEAFALTPNEKENIKIGILGYIFDHYYEALGGIKISDLSTIFTDITNTFKTVGNLTKGGIGGVMSDPMGKFDAIKDLTQGGNESLSKVTNLLDNSASIEDRVKNHIAQKFGLLTELLAKKRPLEDGVPSAPDSLSGFLSDPQNLIDIEKRFPAKTVEEFEQQIKTAPQLGPERTVEMAGRLKKVFENKTAILDKVTGTGKNILDMFADSPDTGGPMSWGRDMVKGVLKFLAGLPFIGNFLKTLLGVDASEDIESYFGDEKRFQRLSAKSLRSLSQSKNSLLSGKNLVNVTTKRLAPFTKAYMPLSMTPEQKIPAIEPKTWSQIIDQGQIPVIKGTEKGYITIPDNQRIVESDFLNGKPGKTFFDKINALTEVLAGKTPEAPTKTPESIPATSPNTAPQEKIAPPVASTESMEGKTKPEIESTILAQGNGMLDSYKKDLEKITDKTTKAFLEPLLGKIGKALNDKDVSALKASLQIFSTPMIQGKLTSEQGTSLKKISTLINYWEKAPEALTSIPSHPIAKTDSPEIRTQKVDKKESGWKDIVSTGLDFLQAKLKQ